MVHKDLIEEARQTCQATLDRPELLQFAQAARTLGFDRRTALTLVSSIDETPASSVAHGSTIKSLLAAGGQDGILERYLTLESALASLEKLADLPVPAQVKKFFCDDVKYFATADSSSLALFKWGTYHFAALCKLASLRRFPAGQMDWEVSGLPRSRLLRVPMLRVPEVLRVVAVRLRGLYPLFFGHLACRQSRRPVLLERELNRTYYQIALALKLQPMVLGFYSVSWFYSSCTYQVSPHLSWLAKAFSENGGIAVNSGPADLDSGVFTKSPERKKAYEQGKFRPTLGLAIWPRREMIDWAERHPEFEPV